MGHCRDLDDRQRSAQIATSEMTGPHPQIRSPDILTRVRRLFEIAAASLHAAPTFQGRKYGSLPGRYGFAFPRTDETWQN